MVEIHGIVDKGVFLCDRSVVVGLHLTKWPLDNRFIDHSFQLSCVHSILYIWWSKSGLSQSTPTFGSLFSLHVCVAAYLSSFWKLWSPRSRSLKRKRGGSGGTSLSCCSILRVEMSKITPLWLMLVWSGAGEELETKRDENSKEGEGKWWERKRSSAKVKGAGGTGNVGNE